MEEVGKNLQRQFETLSQKVRYKLVSSFSFPSSSLSELTFAPSL